MTPEEVTALTRVRDEDFPGYSLGAVARKLLRDELVRLGVLALPASNRSKGARRVAK